MYYRKHTLHHGDIAHVKADLMYSFNCGRLGIILQKQIVTYFFNISKYYYCLAWPFFWNFSLNESRANTPPTVYFIYGTTSLM